jgi:hypothetical protein
VRPKFLWNNVESTSVVHGLMVHANHFDIFGFFHPRDIQGWHAGDWFNDIYTPKNSLFAKSIQV